MWTTETDDLGRVVYISPLGGLDVVTVSPDAVDEAVKVVIGKVTALELISRWRRGENTPVLPNQDDDGEGPDGWQVDVAEKTGLGGFQRLSWLALKALLGTRTTVLLMCRGQLPESTKIRKAKLPRKTPISVSR